MSLRGVLACCLLACLPAFVTAEPSYTLTDLGPALTVAALSQRGVPVGSLLDPDTHEQTPALFLPSGARELAVGGRANGIFDQVAVGYTAHGTTGQEAFAWTQQRGLRFLGLLPGGRSSAAAAINPLAVVVGYGSTATQAIVPTVFWLGHTWALPLPHGGEGHAAAVSPFGRVVGDADTGDADGTFHATLWYAGKVLDLGTLGGPYSSATGVSDRPLVIGWSDTPTAQIGFVWTPHTGMQPLPVLSSAFPNCHAEAVNAAGVIVGNCTPKGDGTGPAHAVKWDNGVLQDLHATAAPAGWVLENASGMNASGQIAGLGRFNGSSHGFLLTPEHAHVARR